VIDAPYRPSALAQDFEILGASVVRLTNWPFQLLSPLTYFGKASTCALVVDGDMVYETSVNYDAILAGATATVTYTLAEYSAVTSLLGYSVTPSLSIDTAGLQLWAYVSAADTVTLNIYNPTGGSINLGAATLRLRLRR
jgi:hypothetical protein